MARESDLLLELERQKNIIAAFQSRASKYELTEQKLRDTNHQLDRQFEKFGRIHIYALQALSAPPAESLGDLVCEGIIDIFQLEGAAFFHINLLDMQLETRAALNLDCPPHLPITKEWLEHCQILADGAHKGVVESPITSDVWQHLGLAHAVFTPLRGNERQVESLMVGAVTEASRNFYSFEPKELLSSFLVYCQLMQGIMNTRAALARAQHNALAKNRFLANLSHEIRTPMNAITGMVQLAARTSNLTSLKQFFRQIDLSSRHLLGLLNEVLDIAKIDEGKLTLAEEPFTLRERIEALASSFTPMADAKQQNLCVSWELEDSPDVLGDPIRLGQVLLNLLSNAIKFTPEGGRISLDVQEISREPDKVLLRFAVSDTGKGVSKEARARIFTAFEQEDGGISRRYGGTGLGLTVSQRIVELMGGTLCLESEEGKGSTFHFTVPFPLAAKGAVEVQEAEDAEDGVPDFSAFRVLVVDDVAVNREIAAALLEDTGIQVEQAEDGKEALRMVLGSPQGHYDCILMDVQMPVLDGCSAARAIRASDHPDAAAVFILALTANVFTEDVKSALDAGMNGYIAKPVEYRSLIKTIARFLLPPGAAAVTDNK